MTYLALRRAAAAAFALAALALSPRPAPAQDDAPLVQVPEAVLQAQERRIQAIEKAVAPTLAIFTPGGQGGGSGVIITPDGYALTNFHVTQPAGPHMKCGMADGKLYDAIIVGIDPVGDLALVKLFGRDDFPVAEMADSDSVRVGDGCFAVGNPFLLATDFKPTVTYGIVSGVHRYQSPAGTLLEYGDCLQTDASINPGNSGGPLFNADGQLIGINGRISLEKRGRVNVGVGYAISINQAKNFIGHLHSGRIIDHATLGATVAADDQGRVLVTNILERSDAYRRGLRYGDEIIAFGGRRIRTANAFKNVLSIFPQGWRAPLVYQRDGQERTIYVRLAGVHRKEELLAKLKTAVPAEEGPPQPEPPDQPNPPRREGPRPDGPRPGPMPPERQPNPRRQPGPGAAQKKPSIPEGMKEHYEERHGYANFHFNALNRDRVWKAFLGERDYAKAARPWTLQGKTAEGAAFRITLAEDGATADLPIGPGRLDAGKDLHSQLDPPGSGGMLAALHLWRRMLVAGPKAYGQVEYLGTAPLPGREGLYDLISATTHEVESHWLFAPDTGLAVAVETWPDVDVDPCELHLHDYREFSGLLLPTRIEVRHGDAVFTTLHVEDWQLAPQKPAS